MTCADCQAAITSPRIRQQFCEDCARERRKASQRRCAAKRDHAEHAQRLREWRAAHPERAKEIQRASWLRHREKRIAEHKAWQQTNKEYVRAKNRARYLAMTDEYKASASAWREANREASRKIIRRQNHKRRALLAQVVYEEVAVEVLTERDKNRCGICGRRVPIKQRSVDHIVPLSMGGPHTLANTQLAHNNCNKGRAAGRTPGQPRLIA